VNGACKQVGVIFVADEQPTSVAEPTDGRVEFPAMPIRAQAAAVLDPIVFGRRHVDRGDRVLIM